MTTDNPHMGTEDNKALLRRFFDEVLNTGNLALADQLLDPGYQFHFPALPQPGGPEVFKDTLLAFRQGFPDLNFTIEDMIAEGDRVAVRFTVRGTHRGDFQGVPPTGRPVQFSGISIYRVAGGKMVEDRSEIDQVSLMQQLGLMPGPEQAPR